MTNVAVIGLGAMGLPIAARLAERFAVTAFDVRDDARAQAREAGIDVSDSVAQSSADADVVIMVVRDATQLEDALFGSGGAAETLREGSVVVVASTVGEGPTAAAEKRLARKAVLCVDAALSGGPLRAREGDLLVMVGGAPEARSQAQPVLEAMATTLFVVGDRVGQGQQLKVINQLLCGIHSAAAAEALALAHAIGLDLDTVISVLSSGAAASFMLADRGPRIAQQLRGETPALRSRLDVIDKDMEIVSRASRSARLFSPVASSAEQLFRAGMVAGLGSEDDSAIVKIVAQNGSLEIAGGAR